MSASRLAVFALAAALLGGCTIIDVRLGDDGIESDALISGFATTGWTSHDPLLSVGLFEDGLVDVTVWKLLRLQVGLIGLSLGVGPFDAGFGVLFYEAEPPHYRWTITGDPKPGYARYGHDDDDECECDECEDDHGSYDDDDDDYGDDDEDDD